MSVEVRVKRIEGNRNQTIGECTIVKDGQEIFKSKSLERGWLNNKQNVSCIPTGKYKLVYEWSPAFNQDLWEIKDVPNRSECKFHIANYWTELNGCIALGLSFSDINLDGEIDVTKSGPTLVKFHNALEDATNVKLIIENV